MLKIIKKHYFICNKTHKHKKNRAALLISQDVKRTAARPRLNTGKN